jgi:uncharacterized protein YndB with AHSA1/START domain
VRGPEPESAKGTALMEPTLATKHTIGGRPVLRFERRLAHPPEKVWNAITDPAEMAHWFPATVETELKVGATMRFDIKEMDVDAPDGEIVELDPPKVFVFTWGDDVLRWELVPDGSGCRLVFTHTFGGEAPFGDELSAARNAAGWDVCLDGLVARLEGESQESSTDAWFERNERYVEEFGLAEGEVRDHPDGYLVRFERDLVQPVEQVWTTLTQEADDIAVGGPAPLRFTNGYVPAGSVTEAEPPRLLEYAWERDGAPAGRVRWELAGQPGGSRLVLTQTVPSRLADLRATALAAWQTHLELFVAALHGPPRAWPAERTEELERRYADRLAG